MSAETDAAPAHGVLAGAAIDGAIAAHAESAFAFLARLVGAPSTVGHEQGALDVFADEAASVGLDIERLPFRPGPINDPRAGVAPRLDPSNTAERYQILATTRQAPQPQQPQQTPENPRNLTLLLNGHIDVVPASTPQLWTSPPFEAHRSNGRMYGRGTGDMKAGLAVGILALRALRDTHPDLFATNRLGFVAVIEEECTGNGALTSITDHGVVADEVVVLESTDLGLLLGGIGVLWIDLTVTAASAHANAVHKSANAIDLGMRLVAALRAWSAGLMASDPEPAMAATGPDAGVYNVNLGTITAGDWASSSPSVANLGIRVGYPRGWSPSRAEAEVRAVIAETAAADQEFTHQPTVVPAGFRARGYVLDADAPLARDLATAHLAAHGEYPVANMTGSTTDARTYLEDFGIPAVCYGPIAHDIHGIDESVELDSIVAAARTLARFIVARFSAAQA